MSQLVVVVGRSTGYGGAWGSGEHLQNAKAVFKKHGGMLSKGYMILTFADKDDFKGVDDQGGVHWVGHEPARREVHGRRVATGPKR